MRNHFKMKNKPQIQNRKSLRLKDYDYSKTGFYFVTIVTQDRECLFGEIFDGEIILNDAGKMIRDIWLQLPIHYNGVKLDLFQVMPSHLHGIIFLTVNNKNVGIGPCACPDRGQPRGVVPTLSLSDIIHRFKTFSTKKYIEGVKQYNWIRFNIKLWQRSFYDHVIKNETDLNNIREYIVNNPVRWELDKENPDVNM